MYPLAMDKEAQDRVTPIGANYDRFQIPGIPEGVLVVRYGEARANEFYLVGGLITASDGYRENQKMLVVCPASDFEFIYDPATLGFRPTRLLQPEVYMEARFIIRNMEDKKQLEAIAKLRCCLGVRNAPFGGI